VEVLPIGMNVGVDVLTSDLTPLMPMDPAVLDWIGFPKSIRSASAGSRMVGGLGGILRFLIRLRVAPSSI
jgi:hypothetical protein